MSHYYKFLTTRHQGPYSGFDYRPFLSQGDKPGPWLPKISGGFLALEPGLVGYHVVPRGGLIQWMHDLAYEVEVGEYAIRYRDQIVTVTMRFLRQLPWDTVRWRLFAADCAEHVLRLYEEAHPRDPRPREAITVARAYARGEANEMQLRSAGWAATQAAAAAPRKSAASEAAGAAAVTASIFLMSNAAMRARMAAEVAADAQLFAVQEGAGPNARERERVWQTTRLLTILHAKEPV